MIGHLSCDFATYIETMIQILLTHLCEEILNKTVIDVEETEDLLVGGLVDSMGMMRFIAFIEKQFALKVPPEI